jgi:hypothetical protein
VLVQQLLLEPANGDLAHRLGRWPDPAREAMRVEQLAPSITRVTQVRRPPTRSSWPRGPPSTGRLSLGLDRSPAAPSSSAADSRGDSGVGARSSAQAPTPSTMSRRMKPCRAVHRDSGRDHRRNGRRRDEDAPRLTGRARRGRCCRLRPASPSTSVATAADSPPLASTTTPTRHSHRTPEGDAGAPSVRVPSHAPGEMKRA